MHYETRSLLPARRRDSDSITEGKDKNTVNINVLLSFSIIIAYSVALVYFNDTVANLINPNIRIIKAFQFCVTHQMLRIFKNQSDFSSLKMKKTIERGAKRELKRLPRSKYLERACWFSMRVFLRATHCDRN